MTEAHINKSDLIRFLEYQLSQEKREVYVFPTRRLRAGLSEQNAKKIEELIEELAESQEDCPPEFAKVFADNYWDLLA